jgi:hypothetical protein
LRETALIANVEIFTHHVGSTGAPIRTGFIRGTKTLNIKKSLILLRGTRRLTFSKRGVQELSHDKREQKKVHQGDASY